MFRGSMAATEGPEASQLARTIATVIFAHEIQPGPHPGELRLFPVISGCGIMQPDSASGEGLDNNLTMSPVRHVPECRLRSAKLVGCFARHGSGADSKSWPLRQTTGHHPPARGLIQADGLIHPPAFKLLKSEPTRQFRRRAQATEHVQKLPAAKDGAAAKVGCLGRNLARSSARHVAHFRLMSAKLFCVFARHGSGVDSTWPPQQTSTGVPRLQVLQYSSRRSSDSLAPTATSSIDID